MVYKDNDKIIDSNLWISYFNDADINHKKASGILKKHKYYNQIMPDLVMYEVVTALKCKVDLDNTLSFIDFIKDNQDITIRLFHEYNREALSLSVDTRFVKLSYVDTLLLYLSKEYTIVTLDKELIKAIDVYGGMCEGE